MLNKELEDLCYIKDIVDGHDLDAKQELGNQVEEILECATNPEVIRQCEVVRKLVIDSLFGGSVGRDVADILNGKQKDLGKD